MTRNHAVDEAGHGALPDQKMFCLLCVGDGCLTGQKKCDDSSEGGIGETFRKFCFRLMKLEKINDFFILYMNKTRH